jgi:hypothetical protein
LQLVQFFLPDSYRIKKEKEKLKFNLKLSLISLKSIPFVSFK